MTITTYSALERPRLEVTEVETDAKILDRFIQDGDEHAFAEIVRRHGPMVLGVCRRIVQNPHDAEDCFQAAFLVLVRKADTIVPRSMVGNFLYGVAYRTALEARKMSAKRRSHERNAQPLPEPTPDRWEELRPVLDREVNRLPDDFRAVLVLCDLEGKTRNEAARELGVPEGTIASRLARARALLARRMSRYSLCMTPIGLAAILAGAPAEADVPPLLAEATVDAAARLLAGRTTSGAVSNNVADLADRVLASMHIGKVKIALAGVFALLMLALGIGTLLPSARADKKPGADRIELRDAVAPHAAAEAITGTLHSIGTQSIILQSEDGEGRLITKKYELDGKIVIVIDGKKGIPGDLKKKMKVTLYMLPQRSVREIKAAGPRVRGVIKNVDPDRRTIAVDAHVEAVHKDAAVTIANKSAKLADLKAGMDVTLQMSAADDPSVVVGIATNAIK